MQELNGATIFDIPLMKSMIHNIRCVSSLINGAKKSGEKQENQGTNIGTYFLSLTNVQHNKWNKLSITR